MTVGPDPTAKSLDDQPLVSAIITTHDRPAYLTQAAKSVADQTYDNLELVVVDDCSNEPAHETLSDVDLAGLVDHRMVRHQTNKGANAARNTGIAAASGVYLAFLDDDDRWLSDKIEKQVAALEASESAVAYTGIRGVHDDGVEVQIPQKIHGDITKALLCRNVVGTMSVIMVRSSLAEDVQFDEAFPSWADLEWYIRLSRRTTFERIPAPLVEYEFTSHSRLSDDFSKTKESYDRFVSQFDSVAMEYGLLFRRKMRGWAAFRAGQSGFQAGQYGVARRFFSSAVASYPFEPRFVTHLCVSMGGPRVHHLVSAIRRQVVSG
ncbi:glycosyltransferase family 2 protein [Halalkalirubrum salinum]|uniref:glycosyltransferase family 2 protein n=1 Tax=Halalkalirubrum salinum TaxID=2563889 RepID=UPI0010FB7C6B|nr:glycosyltransferase family 2 protein [Halalkalirubrum salinum]